MTKMLITSVCLVFIKKNNKFQVGESRDSRRFEVRAKGVETDGGFYFEQGWSNMESGDAL